MFQRPSASKSSVRKRIPAKPPILPKPITQLKKSLPTSKKHILDKCHNARLFRERPTLNVSPKLSACQRPHAFQLLPTSADQLPNHAAHQLNHVVHQLNHAARRLKDAAPQLKDAVPQLKDVNVAQAANAALQLNHVANQLNLAAPQQKDVNASQVANLANAAHQLMKKHQLKMKHKLSAEPF